jgi:hypothetical protein
MRITKQIRPECGLQGLVRPNIYKFRFDKSTLAHQCKVVCENLGDLIAATKVPGRSKHFRLMTGRTETAPTPIERRLEQAIWNASRYRSKEIRLGDTCKNIHTYQCPLWRHKGDLSTAEVKGLNEGWRKSCVDLIGIDSNGFPVVVELKQFGKGTSNPLHMLVEAALYGVAILRMWPDIRHEWKDKIDLHAPASPLSKCRLIGVAPKEYWDYWFADESQRNLWEPLERLRLKLEAHRLPASFASFRHEARDEGLPDIRDLRLISLPGSSE